MSELDLTVAVINHETAAALGRCLASLLDPPRPAPLDVLVIDNASRDGSAEAVRRRFGDRVRLVANRRNLGFGAAINQALARSTARYLLVLNADIEVQERGAIEALYRFLERTPRAGLAAARLLDRQGRLLPSCRRFYTPSAILLRRTPLGALFPRHPALRDHLMIGELAGTEPRVVDWVQGACVMLRRQAMDELGGMDERFFLYFEDVDLCRRMTEGGWQVYYVPEACLVHDYRRRSYGGLLTVEKAHHLLSGLRYLAKWHLGLGWKLRR